MDSAEITRVRAIPLAAVLERLGAERDPKDPAHNWRIGGSRITVNDSLFYDHNQAGARHRMREGRAGGAGAIDLIQYVKDVGFVAAVRELGGMVHSPSRDTPSSSRTEARVSGAVAAEDSRPPPSPAPDRVARARWYLSEVRAIPTVIVDRALQDGHVFADVKGNVVFRLSNEAGQEVGYEVRGTYDKPYHSVHGEKGLFIVRADATPTAAFVESGVEALSYKALRGTGLILSTTGSAVEAPARMAEALKARGFELVAAFNADLAGDRLAARLGERLGLELRRDRPAESSAKDWNEVLQHRRAVETTHRPAQPDSLAQMTWVGSTR
jgi:hypothetical protein